MNKGKVNKIEIKKKDHRSVFDSVEWRIKWKWTDREGPVRLINNFAQYGIPKCAKADYENKLHDWINRKWLLKYEKIIGFGP